MNPIRFTPDSSPDDAVTKVLHNVARGAMIVAIGLLPIMFIPSVFLPLSYGKTLLVLLAVVVAVVCSALALLRVPQITFRIPYALTALWAVAGVAVFSAVVSGDISDAFLPDTLAIASAFGTVLLALTTTVMVIVSTHRPTVVRLGLVLFGAVGVLALWHVLRLVTGADLSGGLFGGSTSTPLGSWNDLGILYGLVVTLLIVASAQLRLSKTAYGLVAVVTGLSLIILAVVNFFAVWVLLGLISIVMLIVYLSRPQTGSTPSLLPGRQQFATRVLGLTAMTFVVAATFIVGGNVVSGVLSNATGISYVEVRPSATATFEIAQATLSERTFTGVGPNKFVDAWRAHKDPQINETLFWNTDFGTGYSYLLTSVVELGVPGALAWLIFLGLLIMAALRTFFGAHAVDQHWSFALLASFVATVYLWGMSIISVPSVGILVLTAASTGLFLGLSQHVVPKLGFALSCVHNARTGFVLIAFVLVIVSGAILTFNTIGTHILATVETARAQIVATDFDQAQQYLAQAYEYRPSDARAQIIALVNLQILEALLSAQTELTTGQQQRFESAAANGVNAAQLATQLDPTEPANWRILGRLYGILAVAGIEGAADRATEAFAQARQHDPHNPSTALLEAQLAQRTGNIEGARERIAASVAQKSNYTDALLLLSQIEVAEGNVAEAIAATEAVIILEPQNPARYYQLAVLYNAQEEFGRGVELLTQALTLDPQYANARYLRALTLLNFDEVALAISDMEIVAEQNPDNEQVVAQLAALRNGDFTPPTEAPALEEAPATDGDAVVVESDPDTDLVTPVNGVPDTADDEAPGTDDAAAEETAADTDISEETQ